MFGGVKRNDRASGIAEFTRPHTSTINNEFASNLRLGVAAVAQSCFNADCSTIFDDDRINFDVLENLHTV